jgi:hypothetical protein
MDISSDETSRNSVKEFQEELTTLIDAGAGIIHVRTHEPIRASLEIRKIALADGFTVREWDVVNGFRDFTEDDIGSVVKRGDGNIDAMAAFATPLDHIRDPGHARTRQYYVYVGLHPFMENNPQMHYLVSLYGHILPAWDCPVILVTPDTPLPLDHESIMSVYFRPPGFEELKVSLNSLIEPSRKDFPDGIDVEADGENKICYVGAGLKQSDFEMYTALSIIKAGREGKTAIDTEDIIRGVAIGKTEIVRQSEILELYPSGDMQNVGGMENLKKWVARRRGCYSDEAREFGVEPPKGIVLVGVPGSGKSLIAKSISSELGVPLVRLDFGRVFNSLVGASENRMRQALRQVEDMAPVVLFCVDGKTEVTIADGSKERIEDMYRKVQEGHSYTLRGMDPNSGELIDLPMRTIIRTQGKPMLRVTTDSGRAIEVTHDHRLLVNRQGERAWIHAEDLVDGDDLVEV